MTRRGIHAGVVLAALALLLATVSGCEQEDVPPAPTPARAAETPTSDARPTVRPIIEWHGPCDGGYFMDQYRHFLHWTPDGAYLVFDVDATIWTLDVEESRLLEVANAQIGEFHADVSSDGSRIVYSTCEHQPPPAGPGEYPGRFFEIAVVDLDGTGRRRLTETEQFDSYPTWSHDGTYVAFVTTSGSGFQLAVMAVETGELQPLVRTRNRVALHPPSWSPDGRLLAFIANEGQSLGFYTIGADDEGLTRIGGTTALPTWSPDGELAFAAVEGEAVVLYAAGPDGTGQREIWRSGPDGPSSPITQVSWSPDGSELLFVAADGVYVISVDGSGLRSLSPGLPKATILTRRDGSRVVQRIAAAWSPDGSRIAAYYPRTYAYPRATRPLLVTVSADGTDLRALAAGRGDSDRGIRDLRVLDPPQPEKPVDLAVCSAGAVVPDPEENPGLVRDCEVLLSIRDRLAGGSKLLVWNEFFPIEEWIGVSVGADPPRVRALSFRGRYSLSGTLPPELGRLAELRTLSLAGNYLSGGIPPELGELSKLVRLNLNQNFLTGPIPPQLGGLTQLEELDVSDNFLTGCFPGKLLPDLRIWQIGLEWCAE